MVSTECTCGALVARAVAGLQKDIRSALAEFLSC
jgi:hypothetical protein